MSLWLGKKKFIFVTGSFLSLFFPGLSFFDRLVACPQLLSSQRIPWDRPQLVMREQLQLFSYDQGMWKSLPLQLDPMDSDGDLIFPVPDNWMQDRIAPFDRISFSPSSFAARYEGALELPCAAREVFELRLDQKFAYLAACTSKPEDRFQVSGSPVTYDRDKRTLRTEYYHYRYSERNHLVFDAIELADPLFKSFRETAARSDLVIIGDVKNFLTLVFDTDDMDARILHRHQGPMGLVGGLQFFLKVLAFRIELALMPEVNFFDDSLYMPMTMYLPVDAAKYLRRGSGAYYTWDRASQVTWDEQKSRIEILDPEAVNPKKALPLSAPDLRYCTPKLCTYELQGAVGGRAFSLNFEITREAAALGFFPRLIRDVPAVEKVLGRPISQFPAKERMGVFFETALLPKGKHKWNFWIQAHSEHSATCGRDVSIRSLPMRKASN